MKIIDAEALRECIRKKLGIKSFSYLLPSERAIVDCIDTMPTIEANQWIPVTDTERLPKVGQAVLWCDGQGNVFTTAITYKEGSSWKVGNRHRGANIVAWMEPPKPFKGE